MQSDQPVTEGKITSVTPNGITIFAPYRNVEQLCERKCMDVLIILQDARLISPDQRRKVYALIGEISAYSGTDTDDLKETMKREFLMSRMDSVQRSMFPDGKFSLSSVDITTARNFITYLTDLVIEYDIPTKVPLYTLCEDISQYVYACLTHKKCAVCGRIGADLHHVDRIGMGGDRTEKPQLGCPVYSLCREHHNESHAIGESAFSEKYHLEPVPLDEKLAAVYHLSKKARREAT